MKKRTRIILGIVLAVLLALALLIALSRCDPAEPAPEAPTNPTGAAVTTPTSGTEPTVKETDPTVAPTAVPTTAPTAAPTDVLTQAPTQKPTAAPTQKRTQAPTQMPTEKPTQAPTQKPTKAPTQPSGCTHTFGEWKYEEYTYKQADPFDGSLHDRVSHRKVRSCTKCGYKEYGNTPDHSCKKGSSNHTVSTIKEGTCTTPAKMRSTCKICGWYVDYDGKKGSHAIKTETRHLTDYGTYTNELDVVTQTCTSCGATESSYTYGEGFADYNRYRNAIVINQGTAFTGRTPSGSDFLEHPTWQTVIRDYKYDSEGYVKQFTVYWYSTAGTRYSYVVDCTPEHLASWFAEYGLTGGEGCKYQFKISGGTIVPYKVSWTS